MTADVTGNDSASLQAMRAAELRARDELGELLERHERAIAVLKRSWRVCDLDRQAALIQDALAVLEGRA